MKLREGIRWFTESKTVPWEYQTFRRRFFAGMIDGFVMMPAGAVLMFILRMDTLPVFVLLPAFILHRTMYYIYSIPLHGLYGQTIGKRVMKVKVLAQDETPLGMRRAFMRDAAALLITIAGLVLVIPACLESGKWVFEASSTTVTGHSILIWTSTLWFFTEVFTMLVSERRRALHDVIAGSVVVRTEKLEAEDDVPVRTSGMPATTLSPLIITLTVCTAASLFIGIRFYGHKIRQAIAPADRTSTTTYRVSRFAKTDLSVASRKRTTYVSMRALTEYRDLMMTHARTLSPCEDIESYNNIMNDEASLTCDMETPLNSVFSLQVSGCDDAKAIELANAWAQRIIDSQDSNDQFVLRIISSAQMTEIKTKM